MDMQQETSRPSRARGLKHEIKAAGQPVRESRPSRARGLKLEPVRMQQLRRRRAPRGRVD